MRSARHRGAGVLRVVFSCVAALTLCACARRASPPDTLVFLNERDVEGLDPHTSGEVWQTQVVLSNVYETLVTFDPQMAIVPSLATSWSNPDDLTWEFRLARNVPFHSGGTLTAEDVVFSLKRARDDARSVLRSALANVTDVAAAGDDLVRIKTREPDASLIARLREVFVVSKAAVTGPAGDAATASAGTGPYRLARRMPGKYVDLVRFDAYRSGPAAIPNVRFVAR
ncbi:MAG TPA: ABC transporter substrate-binding protein, partial [Thermoanaerobaculia bacterium]|nr:ABC transporter substrate-binding protein [Thermoanaerobaculia bacterium]